MFKKGIVGMLVMVVTLVGCSSGAGSTSSSSYSEEVQMGMAKEEISYDMAVGDSDIVYEMVPEFREEIEMAGNPASTVDTSISLERKIIKTGYLTIETKTFEETNRELSERIKALGGFTENETIYGNRHENYSDRTREMTIRIPAEHFDTFINGAGNYGNVTRTSVNNKDITDQYVDYEIRLETLLIQKNRLQELLSQAGELADLFAIENELADVTYEIEKIKGSLNKYDSLMDYATINLYIQETLEYKEVQEPSPTLGGKIANQFKDSIKQLGDLAEWIVLFVVGASPFLVILGVVALVIFKVIKKKSNKTKQDEKE